MTAITSCWVIEESDFAECNLTSTGRNWFVDESKHGEGWQTSTVIGCLVIVT